MRWAGISGGVWPDPYAVDLYPLRPEPKPEPEPPPEQDETPPTLGMTLARMAPELRPEYQRIGTLKQAVADPRATGAGLYFLEFIGGRTPRGYSGMSMDLRQRLQKHVLCAHIMNADTARIMVYVASGMHRGQRWTGDALKQQLLLRERTINDLMMRHYDGRLANQRRELELELFGETAQHHGGCACGRCRRGRS